jgi:hypothetical protein
MVTEDMVNACVRTYYSTLAGISFRILGELDSVRVGYLRDLYAEGFKPHIDLQYAPSENNVASRAFQCARSAGACQFLIARVTFVEWNGDVCIAVKATRQAPNMPSTEFLEVFVASPEGEKLLMKQQSYNESAFVR